MPPQQTSPSRESIHAPSLAELAAQALTDAVLAGEFQPGERLVEERLCERFDISRPPLREALKMLEHLGLVVQVPRRGAMVAPLTHHDVYEIMSLRDDLEQMAMRLALPNLESERLAQCHTALAAMGSLAELGDDVGMVRAGYEFHISVVSLAGHRRLEKAYRSMAMQLELCMAMNNKARRGIEDLEGNVERHRKLLRIIETGDLDLVLHELRAHGHHSFLIEAANNLGGATPESAAWIASLRP